MGTPIPPPTIPDPVPAGDPCDFCWGSGKPFGAGPTPESILATIFGIQHGPNWIPADGDALEGEFILPQNIAVPCLFRRPEGGGIISVIFLETVTGVSVINFLTNPVFSYTQPPACATVLANEENDHFVGGTMTLTITKVI